MSRPLLSVRDLVVRFPSDDGVVKAVDGLSFDLERGRTLGIVGESGSGKTVANLAIMGLHERRSATITGEVTLDGTEILSAPERVLERLRGRRMSMVFQDPITALSPFYTVGHQIAETYRKHRKASKQEAAERAVEMLDRVGIAQPRRRAGAYPHQLSGGMCQRVMIAMALVCEPDLLIADEPTTALDVTVQAQVLDLLAELQRELGTAVILVTHDLGVIAETADEVLVMYAGRCVERGPARQVLRAPEHPYTWGLLASVPRLHGAAGIELKAIAGSPPSLIDVPGGCPFHPRCAYAGLVGPACSRERPALLPSAPGRELACHLPGGARRQAPPAGMGEAVR